MKFIPILSFIHIRVFNFHSIKIVMVLVTIIEEIKYNISSVRVNFFCYFRNTSFTFNGLVISFNLHYFFWVLAIALARAAICSPAMRPNTVAAPSWAPPA